MAPGQSRQSRRQASGRLGGALGRAVRTRAPALQAVRAAFRIAEPDRRCQAVQPDTNRIRYAIARQNGCREGGTVARATDSNICDRGGARASGIDTGAARGALRVAPSSGSGNTSPAVPLHLP